MATRRDVLAALAILPFVSATYADERPEARQLLFERLRNASTEREGRRAEDAVWRLWMAEAPTPEIAASVADAMRLRELYDWDGALAILDRVVVDAPRYAEGWNQRAFIRFLKRDLDGSLEDIEHALRLEPLHFAALAGKATILMQQGRTGLAQTALREAVAIHPWIRERAMLLPSPGGIPQGEGKDI